MNTSSPQVEKYPELRAEGKEVKRLELLGGRTHRASDGGGLRTRPEEAAEVVGEGIHGRDGEGVGQPGRDDGDGSIRVQEGRDAQGDERLKADRRRERDDHPDRDTPGDRLRGSAQPDQPVQEPPELVRTVLRVCLDRDMGGWGSAATVQRGTQVSIWRGQSASFRKRHFSSFSHDDVTLLEVSLPPYASHARRVQPFVSRDREGEGARVLAGDFSYLPKPYELEKLIEVLKDAYEARLKKKFAADEATVEKILTLAPGENPFGILRKMRELDDSRR